MEKELLEQMADKVHDAWWEEKKEQGFHHPNECKSTILLPSSIPYKCQKCHKDMKPYAELDEKTKELDRVMVRTFMRHLNNLGYLVSKTIDQTKQEAIFL